MYEPAQEGEWHKRLLSVTAALYRVTGLLPIVEPLRVALRRHANDVLAGCIGEMHGLAPGSAGLESKIETLLGLLAIARTLPEVRQENFFVLEREYRETVAVWAQERKARLTREERRGEVRQEKKQERVPPLVEKRVPLSPIPAPSNSRTSSLNERQRTILDRLAKTDTVKVSDFYEIFRGISPKTIQRDLQDLVSRNVIRKTGEKRWTVYMRVGGAPFIKDN